jgi:hypothetical protein
MGDQEMDLEDYRSIIKQWAIQALELLDNA